MWLKTLLSVRCPRCGGPAGPGVGRSDEFNQGSPPWPGGFFCAMWEFVMCPYGCRCGPVAFCEFPSSAQARIVVARIVRCLAAVLALAFVAGMCYLGYRHGTTLFR
jgi:hypothetical protein